VPDKNSESRFGIQKMIPWIKVANVVRAPEHKAQFILPERALIGLGAKQRRDEQEQKYGFTVQNSLLT